MPLNCRIGRQIAKLIDVPPDPVYKLAWTPRNPQGGGGAVRTATVTLKWISVAGEGERLELVNVVPENGGTISPLEVKLKLNTMLSRGFLDGFARIRHPELLRLLAKVIEMNTIARTLPGRLALRLARAALAFGLLLAGTRGPLLAQEQLSDR